MKEIRPELYFIMGIKIGELAKNVEMVISSHNTKDKRFRVKLGALIVYENLRDISEGLKQSNTHENIVGDIDTYLDQITKKFERHLLTDSSSDEKSDSGLIVTKLKKRIQTLLKGKELNLEETIELNTKLASWKDRLVLDLLK